MEEIETLNKVANINQVAIVILKLVSHLKFLTNYKFFSVRFIDVKRRYLDPTVYKHQVSDLSGEIVNKYQYSLKLSSGCLNSSSILIFKTDQITKINKQTEYLSLWPLIVDINAFGLSNETPELYTFAKKGEKGQYIFRNFFEKSQTIKEYQDIDLDLEPNLKVMYFNEFESRIHATV
jgi:hypothetical protein